MKIRLGPVANSSSSSFVLKTNKTDEELYQDIQNFFKAYNKYQGFLRGKRAEKCPTIQEIKNSVEILRADENGTIEDEFINTWYKEDHGQADDFFKGTTVIYGDHNFLPADIYDFYWDRDLYDTGYKLLDGCTHMG